MPIISKITGAPFRFWCQKILPAVYDDSLSYYELLCKVVDYLNKVMEDDINVVNLVNELEDFVNNYFDNLDVQEEINNKLDSMAEDGSLIGIIAPHLDPIIEDYEATLDADLADYKDTIDADITAFKGTVNDELDAQDTEIDAFKSDVNAQMTAQNTEIANFKSTVNTTVAGQDNDISVMQAQMSNFLDSYSDIQTFTELYTATATNGLHYIGQTIDLSDPYTDYEELDIYWRYNSDEKVIRVKSADLLADGVYISWYVDKSPDTGIPAPMYIALMKVMNGNVAHTQLTLGEAYSEEWNGLAASDATRDKSTTASDYTAGEVYKIVGVTYTTSAELTDIRVGTNGEIYSTAGVAVREQFSRAQDRLLKLDGTIIAPPYEIGSRYIEDGIEKWYNFNKRMSFKRGFYITLKQGDIVTKNASLIYEFGGGYSTDNGATFTAITARSSRYIAPYDGIYFFWTSKVNNGTFTDNDVLNSYNALYFTRYPNIADTVNYIAPNVEGLIAVSTNLENGFYSAGGSVQVQTADKEKYTQQYNVIHGMTFDYTLSYLTSSHGMWIAVGEWLSDGTFYRRNLYSDTTRNYSGEYEPADNVMKVAFMFRGFDDFEFLITSDNTAFNALSSGELVKYEPVSYTFDNHIVKGINHRGYNRVAPENTLPAFKLSAVNGFSFVETDVRFTSDNVPVLLHDATINRTARNVDGSTIEGDINIADITYEQALQYVFCGSKYDSYPNVKIPTFEEFIVLCRNLNLYPYIEVSGAEYTSSQIEMLVGIVKKYNMQRSVTWISFYNTNLRKVVANDQCARVGRLPSANITESVANSAVNLRTGKNEVFIDLDLQYVGSESVNICSTRGLPLEAWTVNTDTLMLSLPSYVSGATSDTLNFETVIRDNELS